MGLNRFTRYVLSFVIILNFYNPIAIKGTQYLFSFQLVSGLKNDPETLPMLTAYPVLELVCYLIQKGLTNLGVVELLSNDLTIQTQIRNFLEKFSQTVAEEIAGT